MALGTNFFGTPQQSWQVGSETNATPQASFSLQAPTTTKPASDEATSGVIVFEMPRLRNLLKLLFFGRDANDEKFDVRLIGWKRIGPKGLWIPTTLAEAIDVQLNSSLPGVSGEPVTASDFFADNFASTNGNTVEETSLAGKGIAQLVIDPLGSELIQADFKQGTATAAAVGNLLYSGD